jgi:hypothetical protein
MRQTNVVCDRCGGIAIEQGSILQIEAGSGVGHITALLRKQRPCPASGVEGETRQGQSHHRANGDSWRIDSSYIDWRPTRGERGRCNPCPASTATRPTLTE